ncbi:hypothetical protein EV368DRAFT_89994 [Lentinula lateritia]|nr:hypothetical protein EV368DRAFT_89994 [Lentinula lateritia]
MFASWDVTTRLTFNKENNANNIRCDLQRAAHLRDPENIRAPSPVTSELTIQPEEWEKIRTNPFRFESLKHLIPDFILEWMESRKNQEDKDKRKREEDMSIEAEEEKKKKRRLAEPLVPVMKNPLVPFQANFHDALYEIAHVSPIPLPFFSNDSLQFISARAHSLPRRKYKSNDPRKSGYFIDLEALKKLLRIKYAKDNLMEGLDYILFVECINNYMRFETSCDPEGSAGSRAQFIIQHFSFFLNKCYTAKLYTSWKPAELRIRNEQYLEFMGFVQSAYGSEWTKVESRVEFEETMAKSHGTSTWHSYPFQSNSTSNPSSSSYSNQPFPQGSKGNNPGPCCIGCSQRGHKLGDHKDRKQGPLLLDTTIPAWSPQIEQPREFVSASRCPALCTYLHICSLCGSKDHHAGKCKYFSA